MTEFKRITSPEEFDSLAEFASVIWHEHFTSIIGEAQVCYMLERFQSSHAMQEQAAEGYRYYRAYEDGKSCGYCAICPHEDHMYISKFYMHADYRRKGIGRKMMELVKDEARKDGFNKVRLNVNKHNFAIDVYKRLGFKIVADEVIDIGGGFAADDYVMEIDI